MEADRCRVYCQFVNDAVEALRSQRVTELDGSVAGWNDDAARLLADELEAGNGAALRRIVLHHSVIYCAGTALIADALEAGACPLLEELDLSSGRVCEAGAARLAGLVESGACPELGTIRLDDLSMTAATRTL